MLLHSQISRFYCNLLISAARLTDEVIYSQISSRSAMSAQWYRALVVSTRGDLVPCQEL